MSQQGLRESIIAYLKELYNTTPETLWIKYPNYTVFRRNDNKKWYAVIMDIPKNKLGYYGNETVDVLNVKCGPILMGSLLNRHGFHPAYHMNKANWISIVLDNSVLFDDIKYFLNVSYKLTEKINKV